MTEQNSEAIEGPSVVRIECNGVMYSVINLEQALPMLAAMQGTLADESLAILGLDYLAEAHKSLHGGICWSEIRMLYEMLQALKEVVIEADTAMPVWDDEGEDEK